MVDIILTTGTSHYVSTRTQIEKIHRKIYRCVMFYNDIPNTNYVKTELRFSPNRHRISSYMQQLEQEGNHVFVLLNHIAVHIEYLSNPIFPKHTLCDLNGLLFSHVLAYLQCLQNIFSVMSSTTISTQLTHRIYDSPAAPSIGGILVEIKHLYHTLKTLNRDNLEVLQSTISHVHSLEPSLYHIISAFQQSRESLQAKRSIVKLFNESLDLFHEAETSFAAFNIHRSTKKMKSFARKMVAALDSIQALLILTH